MIGRESIGVVAGLLSLVSCPIYLVAIFAGETKPNRVTWWVLLLSAVMLCASNWAVGARETIWLPAAYCVNFLAVAIVSLRYGEGEMRLGSLDRVCLSGALASALFWWIFRSPATAQCLGVATEFAGLLPTIVKAYRRPWTEDRFAWGVAAFASFLNLFALSRWSAAVAAYPIYMFITNTVVAVLLLRPHIMPPSEHAAGGSV